LFLRFAFEGRAYQHKVLPFGLALSPGVLTKLAEGALAPLWEQGIRILNYLDDWLIIAHLRDLSCEHRDLVLRHLNHVGLRHLFSREELDSVNINTEEHVQHKITVPLKLFQRLLGHMVATAAVIPLGLLHMRPLQHWLHGRIPRWAWHCGTFRVSITLKCRRYFSPWHLIVNRDASKTVWGAVCNRQAASGSWTGPRLQWHNCLELLAVLLALRWFRPMLQGKHVLVHMDVRLHQSPKRFAFSSHVVTRPPSPSLESDAAQIAACHSHSGRTESSPSLENGDSFPRRSSSFG
ncbi:hypothetical protein M9458_026182, partial [Cirrhinus mrigala]